MDTVGIVGLGVMGSNCAKKLMESGVPVAGYDPYPPAVKRASEAGVSMCGSPAELAGKAGVILMFVPGPADTEKVVLGEGGIASRGPRGHRGRQHEHGRSGREHPYGRGACPQRH